MHINSFSRIERERENEKGREREIERERERQYGEGGRDIPCNGFKPSGGDYLIDALPCLDFKGYF